MTAERKVVTVLFADIVGSTPLSERLDPERLRSVLDDYFTAMSNVIEAWGGTVEKFVGDAIVAIFGVPAVREDDAQRALHASLEMLRRLDQLNEELDARHHLTLDIRIGVNTGEVLASTEAGDQRLVSGDAVNVAARFEGAAEPGTVLVGERTYLACRRAFRFAEVENLSLKGKERPVAARRLFESMSEPERGVAGLQARMVGRDSELAALLGHLEEVARSGRPRLVTVLGPAGVGKSRLIREFVESARVRQPNLAVLRGRCLAAGHGVTYWALGEVLRGACAISLDDPAGVAQDKLRATLSPILGGVGLDGPAVESTVAALATTAGIPFPHSPFERLAPQALADELARAWPRFTGAWVRGRVGVMVLEDLHWADEALLGMLEHIVGRTGGGLLVVATSRPEMSYAHPDFGAGRDNFSLVSLGSLTTADSGEMLHELLSGSELPEQLLTSILDRADGNPFFLEEIVGRLTDEGALVRAGAAWHASPDAGRVPLPDSIQSLLAARIDALTAGEKRVLQEAAVVGRVFWEQLVSMALSDERVSDHLEALERKGFIVVRPASSLQGQQEYGFRHALVRDVAYGSLMKARRLRAHAEVASWIEQLAGARREEFAELVATHYAAATEGEDIDLGWPDPAEREQIRRRAFESLLQAGVGARRRFAVSRAIQLHEQALQLAGSDAERMLGLEEVADDHSSAYHGDDAKAAYEEALVIARSEATFAEDRARLCWKLAWMMAGNPGAFRSSPRPEPVDELVVEGLTATTDEAIRVDLIIARGATARLWKGSEPFGQGDRPDPIAIDDRIDSVEQALATAKDRNLPRVQMRATETLAILFGIAGRHQATLDLARRRLVALGPRASVLERADALRQVAVLTMSIDGRYADGLELAERALALTRDSNPHQLMHATSTVMEALYHLGRWDELGSVLEEHLRGFAEDPAVECQFVRDGPVIGATVFAHRGLIEDADRLAGLLPDPLNDESASAWQARFSVAIGRPETARRISRERALVRRAYGPAHALALVEALLALGDWDGLATFLPGARVQLDGCALLGPWCELAAGAVSLGAGDARAARSHLQRAVDRFDELKAAFDGARSRMWLARVVEPAAAKVVLESAQATFTELGAMRRAEQAGERLSVLDS